MTGWVDAVAAEDEGNWAICKQLGLWGTASSNPVNARAGDDLFLWKSGQGWLTHCQLTSDPEPVGSGQALPWPPTRKYVYTMGIRVVAEAHPPLAYRGAEAARQAGFGSTAALGQFARVKPENMEVLSALFEPVSPIESALSKFLRVTEVEVPPGLDDRDYAHRLIAVRRGQGSFRDGLLRAFDRRCCISGSHVEATLEAAHIRPYRGMASHAAGNGLLLRADLHTLFDLHLLTVMPFGTVRVAPDLHGSEYEDFDERQIRRAADARFAPNREALTEHNAGCAWLSST